MGAPGWLTSTEAGRPHPAQQIKQPTTAHQQAPKVGMPFFIEGASEINTGKHTPLGHDDLQSAPASQPLRLRPTTEALRVPVTFPASLVLNQVGGLPLGDHQQNRPNQLAKSNGQKKYTAANRSFPSHFERT